VSADAQTKRTCQVGSLPRPPRRRSAPSREPARGRRQPVSVTRSHTAGHTVKGGGVFSEPIIFFYERAQRRPQLAPYVHTRAHTHVFGHHPATVRLRGWLGAQPSGTQDLRALKLWQSCRQWRAQP